MGQLKEGDFMQKRLIFLLFILVFTAACTSETNDSLELDIDGDIITWSEISNAETYTITHIDSQKEETTEETFINLNVFDLSPGVHAFAVCSDNDLCETIGYTVEDKDSDNNSDDDSNEDPDDNGDADDDSDDDSDDDADDDSDDDDMNEDLVDDIIHDERYRFNTNATQDLIIYLNTNVSIIHSIESETMPLSVEDVIIDGKTLVIEKTLFNGNDDAEITILTDQGKVHLDIRFTDSEAPHFISHTTFTYNYEDILLLFEPLNGEFISLSGNNITENDYNLMDNQLTIKHDYIDSILDENPDRNTIILGYQFALDGDITIGYLFINMP